MMELSRKGEEEEFKSSVRMDTTKMSEKSSARPHQYDNWYQNCRESRRSRLSESC